MFDYIRKKLEKRKLKQEFREYGYKVNKFKLPVEREVAYAQWLHPFESTKAITESKVNFYRKFAGKGTLIVDIGAHTGDTSVPMALAVGAKGLVIALEPNPYVFKVLEANAQLNRQQTNIIPLCFAATEKKGDFVFNYSDASFCNGGFLTKIKNQQHGHKYTLTVKGENLEDYLKSNYPEELKKVSLIKIDAEGFDKDILKTITQIVQEYRPYLLLECYKGLNPQERAALYDAIVGNDYEAFYLEDHEEDSKTIKINSPQDMTKWKHFEILAVPAEKKGKAEF